MFDIDEGIITFTIKEEKYRIMLLCQKIGEITIKITSVEKMWLEWKVDSVLNSSIKGYHMTLYQELCQPLYLCSMIEKYIYTLRNRNSCFEVGSF